MFAAVFAVAALLARVHHGLASDDVPVLTAMSELSLDAGGRLDSHWLLVPPACLAVEPVGGMAHRKVAMVEGALAEIFGFSADSACPAAVALEMGTEPAHVPYHYDRFRGEHADFTPWLHAISQVELGWINFHTSPDKALKLFFVRPDGSEQFQVRVCSVWGLLPAMVLSDNTKHRLRAVFAVMVPFVSLLH